MNLEDLIKQVDRLQERIIAIETQNKELNGALEVLTKNLVELSKKITDNVNLVGKYEALSKRVIDLEKKKQELPKPVERVEEKLLPVKKSFWEKIRK